MSKSFTSNKLTVVIILRENVIALNLLLFNVLEKCLLPNCQDEIMYTLSFNCVFRFFHHIHKTINFIIKYGKEF